MWQNILSIQVVESVPNNFSFLYFKLNLKLHKKKKNFGSKNNVNEVCVCGDSSTIEATWTYGREFDAWIPESVTLCIQAAESVSLFGKLHVSTDSPQSRLGYTINTYISCDLESKTSECGWAHEHIPMLPLKATKDGIYEVAWVSYPMIPPTEVNRLLLRS